MGRSYLFECPKCGFNAKASGGPDHGHDFSVQTIACRDCKKLYDAVTRLRVLHEIDLKPPLGPPLRLRKYPKVSETPPGFESVLNRLPLPGAKRTRWVQFKLRCPVSPLHKVQVWTEPGKCPRCGIYLEKGAVPYRRWE